MKYRIDLSINGYLEIEANSKEEAREIVESGYPLSDLIFEDDEIDDIYEVKEASKPQSVKS